MNRKEIADWILIFLIISLIGVILIGLFTVDKDSFQCLANPIAYHEKVTNQSCVCDEYIERYCSPQIDISKLIP